MKLKEAIDFAEQALILYGEKNKDISETMQTLIQAAKDMQDMIEARKEAIGGHWSQYDGLAIYAEYYGDGRRWKNKMLDVRGWGHLTGSGSARGLPHDEAKKIQVSNANFIVTAANTLEKWSRDE